MRHLHDTMDPQSPSSTGNDGNMDPHRRRRRCKNRKLVGRIIFPHNLLLFGLAACILQLQLATAQQQNQNIQSNDLSFHPQDPQRLLADGLTECTGCNGSNFICSGKTISDEQCSPCASGQVWWPCNLDGECYCKDLAAEALEAEMEAQELETMSAKCDIQLCEPGYTGQVVVPFTKCAKYVVCSAGVPGQMLECSPGMVFSPSISSCNILSLVTCPEDPSCPPTGNPTISPTISMEPTTSQPTDSNAPSSERVASPASGGGSVGGVPNSNPSPVNNPNTEPTFGQTAVDPNVLEGMYVMDAHLSANKVVLTRELLSSPGSTRGEANNDFSYMGFRSSLQTMITTGVANQTFYIGQSGLENGRAYGLVNIAAFLAMSAEDSILHGSCDETNYDLVGGLLPTSNACGQNGMDYSTMTCPAGEEMYNCDVDPTMRMVANDIHVAKYTGGGDDEPPKPFYCGPKSDYGGSTGHWDYVSGAEVLEPPVANAMGQQDVEGW